VLRALEFTQDEADELISLAGLTQARDIALNLGIQNNHESVTIVQDELNMRLADINKRHEKEAAKEAKAAAEAAKEASPEDGHDDAEDEGGAEVRR
jgi:hypothetical protein